MRSAVAKSPRQTITVGKTADVASFLLRPAAQTVLAKRRGPVSRKRAPAPPVGVPVRSEIVFRGGVVQFR